MNRFFLFVAMLVCATVAAPGSLHAQEFLGKRLEKWREDLTDKDAKVRRGAVFALGKFPDSANRVVPLLLQRISEDNDPGVRDAAATALGDLMRAYSPEKSDDADLRITHWKSAEPVLRRALEKEGDAAARRGELYAVGSFGPSASSLADLVRMKLKANDPSTRQNAAWALGRMGAKAADAVDALIDCLKDKEALVRRDAATALGDIGLPAAQEAVRPLLALVENEPDDVVLRTALEKLINLVSEKNKDAANLLYPLLTSDDPDTAHLAAFVLANIGGNEAKPAVKVLRAALNDEEPEVQNLAAAALSNLGKLAAPAVPDLGKKLRTSTVPETRRNCALALAHIGADAKDALPDLVAVLKSDAPIEVRHYCAEALFELGTENEPALPDILTVVAKNEPDPLGARQHMVGPMRQRCIMCFWHTQQLPEDSIPVFTKILDEKGDNSLMVRYDAARLLAEKLGENAPDKAGDWLLHMLRNESLVIYKSTDAKVSGGGEASTGTSKVQANTGGDARFLAAHSLGMMGTKASGRPEIVAELKKAAAEAKDDRLREEARNALKRLRIQ
jgi:HEAT repeat protein